MPVVLSKERSCLGDLALSKSHEWDADSRKGYVGKAGNQVHFRIWGEAQAHAAPDLYCFHPGRFTGLAFATIAPFLAEGRRVIAPDFPGYGGSDGASEAPSIAAYADAMLAVAAQLSPGLTVDVLGFHTGCLVAAETAQRSSLHVRKAVLIDIPAFDAETTAAMLEEFSTNVPLGPDMDCLSVPWTKVFEARRETQGERRAFALFAETLRSGEAQNGAFVAAANYPWAERFPSMRAQVLALATQSSLLEQTRLAASVLSNATLLERLDVKRSVLDENAASIAADIDAFLAGERA